jgi:hypothetical protein
MKHNIVKFVDYWPEEETKYVLKRRLRFFLIAWFMSAMGNPNRSEGQFFAKKSCWGPKNGLLLQT